ncbi:hypothetical protein OPV22_029029 [Ensete ventricosum]|uniref:Uncharacterized protein n=1 Tax=Ensete ventricosum TaxID=4639 RepID=A0AAV8Q016_ENSVE|nr:hypothetical protein OPV22_029029 [Ensete ventricosum]
MEGTTELQSCSSRLMMIGGYMPCGRLMDSFSNLVCMYFMMFIFVKVYRKDVNLVSDQYKPASQNFVLKRILMSQNSNLVLDVP